MFRKSRIRIIASVMASLFVFMALTLGVIYAFSRRSAGEKNAELLTRFVDRSLGDTSPPAPGQNGSFSHDGGTPSDDGFSPDGERIPGGYESGDFPDGEDGSFVKIPDGERNGDGIPPEMGDPGRRPDDRGRDDLFIASTFYSVRFDRNGTVVAENNGSADADEIEEKARQALSSGKTTGRIGKLLYQVAKTEDGTLVAFIDSTVTDEGLTTVLRYELIFGGVGFVLIFILSVFISGRIIKPLEENDKRQRQFVSDAGHELKTPISVISANTELLAGAGESEWISNIRYETERMGALVSDLLKLSRVESAERVTERVDLSRLVTGEELPFEAVAYEKGVELKVDIEPDIHVYGDPGSLRQITAILLDNAIRHGTGKEIALTLRHDRRSAVLCVKNDGEEIPKEVRERLFERFYRRDGARTEGDHFGLGLAIAKAIAEAHRGTIGVECRDGEVIFTVTIPSSGKK